MIIVFTVTFLLSISFMLIINRFLRNRFVSSFGRRERFQERQIDLILKRLNSPRNCFYKSLSDRDLWQILLDYSMNTNNYEAGLKNIEKIVSLSASDDIKRAAVRAREILQERLVRTDSSHFCKESDR